jgi:Xaa-Pro dipeptidase
MSEGRASGASLRPRAEATYPPVEAPRFTLAERDRRWSNLRRLMERDRIDALVALGNTGAWDSLNAGNRYLTTIGGNGSHSSCVFPAEGEVTAYVNPTPGSAYWRAFQDWVTDVRDLTSFYAMTDAVLARLGELPERVQKGRIGLVGLAGLPRVPEGIVSHGSYERIRAALPDAELMNATPLIEEARAVKGREEIAALERSVAIVEAVIDRIAAEARPGVPENVVYARALATMVEEGGEIPTFFSLQAGAPQRQQNHTQPTARKLVAGDVISTEVDACVMGYRGQITQPFVLGRATPLYREMMSIVREGIDRCYAAIRPGATPGDLARIAADVSREGYQCRIVIHGRGLGDDAPLLVFRSAAGARGERMAQWSFTENMALMVKPYVFHGDLFSQAIEDSVGWGDSVVVTATGVRRMGTKPPEIIEIT